MSTSSLRALEFAPYAGWLTRALPAIGLRRAMYRQVICGIHAWLQRRWNSAESLRQALLEVLPEFRAICQRVMDRADGQGEWSAASAVRLYAARHILSVWIGLQRSGDSTLGEEARRELLLDVLRVVSGLRAAPLDVPGLDLAGVLSATAADLIWAVTGYTWSPEQSRRVDEGLVALALVIDAHVPPDVLPSGDRTQRVQHQSELARLSAVFGDPTIGERRALAALEQEAEPVQYGVKLSLVRQAAARRSGDVDQMMLLRSQRRALLDREREKFRTRAGRMRSMESCAQTVGYAIVARFHADVLHPEEILELAEGLKARALLDDIVQPRAAFPADLRELVADLSRQALRWQFPRTAADVDPRWGALETRLQDLQLQGEWPSLVTQLRLCSDVAIDPQVRMGLAAQRAPGLDQLERLAAQVNAGYEGSARPAQLVDIQSRLSAHQVIVELFMPENGNVAGSEIHRFIITRDGMTSCPLVKEMPGGTHHADAGGVVSIGGLHECVARLRLAIERRDDPVARPLLVQLYDWLIGDLERKEVIPPGCDHWIFVPHGALHLVPFAALIDASDRHIVERVAVSVVPSASIWAALAAHPRVPLRSALALGNPYPVSNGLEPLPQAELEAKSLQSQLGDMHTQVMLRADATKEAFLREATQHSLIHIAAHGSLPDADIFNGHAIALAAPPGVDGLLTAEEIRDLQLGNCSLVVLSICEGGVYRIGPGDEPHGLIGAFLAAGARSVLGTHWKTHDEMTRLFMQRFYRSLRGATAAHALREAALSFIRGGQLLIDWSGFVLVGA